MFILNEYRNSKGRLHNENGPAIEYATGTKKWCIDGELHRENGPAIEWANGDKEWWLNNNLHREDGPAIEFNNGDKYWYLNGEELSESELNQLQDSKIMDSPLEQFNNGDIVYVNGNEYEVIGLNSLGSVVCKKVGWDEYKGFNVEQLSKIKPMSEREQNGKALWELMDYNREKYPTWDSIKPDYAESWMKLAETLDYS